MVHAKKYNPYFGKKVNDSPEFAPLRTVYSAAALAEASLWNNTIKEFARLMPLNTIDKGYIHELQTKYESIYNAYKKRFGSDTVIYGGVDFTKPLATTVHRQDLYIPESVFKNLWSAFPDPGWSESKMCNEIFVIPDQTYKKLLLRSKCAIPNFEERVFGHTLYPHPGFIGRLAKILFAMFKTTIYTRLIMLLENIFGDYPVPSVGSKLFKKMSFINLGIIFLSFILLWIVKNSY